MSLTVTITLAEPLSDFELDLLQSLAGQPRGEAPAAAPKTAKKAAAAPAPAPEPTEEDVLGTGEPTLEDAVARATALVAAGKTAQVKAALTGVGAKRVSELSGAKIATFLEALDA